MEAWVVKTVEQPSATVNSHEIESPYAQKHIIPVTKLTDKKISKAIYK